MTYDSFREPKYLWKMPRKKECHVTDDKVVDVIVWRGKKENVDFVINVQLRNLAIQELDKQTVFTLAFGRNKDGGWFGPLPKQEKLKP